MHRLSLWKLKPKHWLGLTIAALIVLLTLALIIQAAPATDAANQPAMTPVNEQFVAPFISGGSAGDYPRVYGANEPPPDGLARDTRPLDQVERIVMPPVDVAQLRAEDAINLSAGEPPRFAYPMAVNIDPSTRGTWEKTEGDRLVWRLRIASPKAASINLGFIRYFMPHGGRLFLYRPDKQIIVGAFTDQDNEAHGQLWTPLVRGDEIVIEVSLPSSERANLQLKLAWVNHGYKGIDEPTSGACNVDVVCPQGDAWRKEIRSVAVYQLSGTWTCTGAMINDTAQDLKPYFLTANHCGVNAGNAATVVTYWNFENSTCRPPGSPASGGPGDGSLAQFLTGAIFRAAYATSDFTLIELDDPVPRGFHVFWAGWDRSNVAPSSAVAIHHPNTDEKRISFENGLTQLTSYLGVVVPGDSTHIRIVDWDLGTTEPGSSGSPLFNPEHRIVGQLHGGYAACGNDLSDYYGRLFLSWAGGGTRASRLSDWLDPMSSGVTALAGREQTSFDLAASPALQAICAPATATYHITVTAGTKTTAPVTLSTLTQPIGTSANFSVNPVTPTGTSVLTVDDTSLTSVGNYNMFIVGTAMTESITLPVGLSISTAAPGASALLTPTNGAIDQPIRPTYGWTAAPQAATYDLEAATDPSFNTIVYAATTTGISHTQMIDLSLAERYYWRVRANNGCGVGAFSPVSSFNTRSGPGLCPFGSTAIAIFSDTFESGTDGWRHGGITDTWTLTGTRTHSGLNAFHVDDPAAADDQYLITPPVGVPGNQSPLTLQFWNHQTMEERTGGCYDGGLIEISHTLNTTWTQITTSLLADPYDGPISSSFSNPLAGRNAWCGDPQDWLNSVINLDAYAGETVQFRFRLGSDTSIGREGWYIDDVLVQSCLTPRSLYLPWVMK